MRLSWRFSASRAIGLHRRASFGAARVEPRDSRRIALEGSSNRGVARYGPLWLGALRSTPFLYVKKGIGRKPQKSANCIPISGYNNP